MSTSLRAVPKGHVPRRSLQAGLPAHWRERPCRGGRRPAHPVHREGRLSRRARQGRTCGCRPPRRRRRPVRPPRRPPRRQPPTIPLRAEGLRTSGRPPSEILMRLDRWQCPSRTWTEHCAQAGPKTPVLSVWAFKDPISSRNALQRGQRSKGLLTSGMMRALRASDWQGAKRKVRYRPASLRRAALPSGHDPSRKRHRAHRGRMRPLLQTWT